MTRRAVLIEDDENGLKRAIRCAPNNQTYFAYTQKDIEWIWVKTYVEFVEYINKNGLPDLYYWLFIIYYYFTTFNAFFSCF